MIALDSQAQKRAAARIASRRRAGRPHLTISDEIVRLANGGFTPSRIAEYFGRSQNWVVEQITRAAR